MYKSLIRPYYWEIKSRLKGKRIIEDGSISYINWQCSSYPDPLWFSKFIKYNITGNLKKKINFYSVYDSRYFVKEKTKAIKIFYSNESLSKRIKYDNIKEGGRGKDLFDYIYCGYNDYCIDDVDLSMGYDYITNKKYIRFPGWIISIFHPKIDFNFIKEQVDNINSVRRISVIKNKAVVVASHDSLGVRSKICDDLKDYIAIDFAGKWRNNTKDLWEKFGNNKISFMNQYKFNICAENMDAKYYVTEKLFESFLSGCIPIYHGSLNNPEPDIIVKDSVIFWDFKSDNHENKKIIKKLMFDENYYNKFILQKKLSKEAPEIIYNKMIELRNKLEILIK